MKVLERQLLSYDPGTKGRTRGNVKTDVLMAFWFASLEAGEIRKRARTSDTRVALSYDASYPDISSFSGKNSVPWQTAHPGAW